MKLCFVLPRYGSEIIGGAEYSARMLAETLVRTLDVSVDVFTTTAKDLETWDNHYQSGTTIENGVRVHRFEVTSRRDRDFGQKTSKLLASAASQTFEVGRKIVTSQGPVSTDLIDAVRTYNGDVLSFYPYLYHTTTEGIRAATTPLKVMHPAAHNEAMLHLEYIGGAIREADALIYHTDSERIMVEELHGVAATPHTTLGAPYRLAPTTTFVDSRLEAGKYLLYVGRVDPQKGVSLLTEYFMIYKERHLSDLRLAIAGPVIIAPSMNENVVLLGTVDEGTKANLLENCLALFQPSLHESFSIVLMEAWEKSRPVVVHRGCAATAEHVEKSDGGLIFDDYLSFEATIEVLLRDPSIGDELGKNGYEYAHNLYFEDNIARRYYDFLQKQLAYR